VVAADKVVLLDRCRITENSVKIAQVVENLLDIEMIAIVHVTLVRILYVELVEIQLDLVSFWHLNPDLAVEIRSVVVWPTGGEDSPVQCSVAS